METKNTNPDATSPSHQVTKSPSHKIAVIGLGYVGLPLARLFATKYPTVGFDINQARIAELNSGTDSTLEVADDILQAVLVDENPFHHSISPSPHHLVTQSPSHPVTQSPRHPVTGLYCSSNL